MSNLNISDVANWLTIIGFIITLLTYIVVKYNKKEIQTLNKKNLFKTRTPENLKELKNTSRTLINLMDDINLNKHEILVQISKLAPILKSIEKSLEHRDLEYLNPLKKEINKHHKMVYTEKDVSWLRKKLNLYVILDENYLDRTYRYLATLITEIENLNKDFRKDLMK